MNATKRLGRRALREVLPAYVLWAIAIHAFDGGPIRAIGSGLLFLFVLDRCFTPKWRNTVFWFWADGGETQITFTPKEKKP